MNEFIKAFDQDTFEGAFLVFCIADAVISALICLKWYFRSKNDDDGQLLAPDTSGGDPENAISSPEANAVPTTAETPTQGGNDDDKETNAFDIETSQDDNLDMIDTEVGLLMFFFTNGNEVCDTQWDAFHDLSLVREEIRFLSVDATDPRTAPIAALHGVHHVPSFVFRRKGDISYCTLTGLLNEQQIADFIDLSMQNSAAVSNGS